MTQTQPSSASTRTTARTLALPAVDDSRTLAHLKTMAEGFDSVELSLRATIGMPPPAAPEHRRTLPRFATTTAATEGQQALRYGEVLGEGGMGVVHAAEQQSLGREVAVKRARDAEESAEAGNRLVVEALLTGALQHPNIVPIYELGVDEEGAPLMVMKRIVGRSWQRDLQGAPRAGEPGWGDWIEAQLRVLLSVCDALRFAHDRGILHRDLKPENVMLGAYGEVLVVDWGVAVSLRPQDAGRFPLARESRHIAGTPAYMAPEQVRGDGVDLGTWTDVYLVGAVLHELLTGRAPHDANSVHASLFSAWRSDPPSLSAAVPEPLADICRRALRREPTERFPDIASLHGALSEYLRNRASIELTERALRQATELAATVPADALDLVSQFDPHGVHRLFTACRFGFQQALEIWPGNLRARDGLQQVLLLMIERSLDAGEVSQASLLSEELPERDASIDARLRKARVDRAAQSQALHQLGAIGHRHDYRVGLKNRRRFTIALATVQASVNLGEGVAWRLDQLNPFVHAALPTFQLVLTFIYGMVRWQSMRDTGVNLRLFHIGTITIGTVAMARLLSLPLQSSLGLVVSLELLMYLVGIGASAAMTRRRMSLAILPYAVGAALGASLQEHAFWIAAAAHVLSIGAVGYGWRDREEWADERGPA